MGDLAAFVGISAVVIVTPGPDTALTIRNTLMGGRSAGVATGSASSPGSRPGWSRHRSGPWPCCSPPARSSRRSSWPARCTSCTSGFGHCGRPFAQAGRPWLGSPWTAAPTRASGGLAPGTIEQPRKPEDGRLLHEPAAPVRANRPRGLWRPSRPGALFMGMTLAWLSAYAAVVDRAGDLFRRSSMRRGLEAITGVVLVALGLRLATESR